MSSTALPSINAAPPGSVIRPYDGLAGVKSAATAKLGRKSDAQSSDTTAQQLVANMFFAPLLEEMRKMPFGKGIGDGGRGEEVFGEQLDNRVAAATAASDPGGVVTHVSRWIEKISGRPAAQDLRNIGTEKANWQAAMARRPADAS